MGISHGSEESELRIWGERVALAVRTIRQVSFFPSSSGSAQYLPFLEGGSINIRTVWGVLLFLYEWPAEAVCYMQGSCLQGFLGETLWNDRRLPDIHPEIVL